MSVEPAIASLGLPPQRHADRVIALMLCELARRRAVVAEAIAAAWRVSKDGTVRSQERMAARIRQAGAVEVRLKPGSRGRYRMTFLELVGWDPTREAEIKLGDPLPVRPRLAVTVTIVKDRGRSRKSNVMMFFSHHCISRCAQRFGVRTMEQIIAVTKTIFEATFQAAVDADLTPEEAFNPPPQGRRILVDDGMVAVVVKHKTKTSLVVTTVLFGCEDGGSSHFSFL